MKITKVYTRGGDMGKTSLVGGQRVSKASVRLEAYGTVDELSSNLGLLAAMITDDVEKDMIIRVQNCLLEMLEGRIDEIMHLLPERQGFVLPGGTKEAAQAHICRTVCRRAERRIVALSEVAQITPQVLQYVNRLSDYLFVLAKKINFNANQSEIIWQNVGR